jgi:superfamily II DNA or RNA helicase
MTPFSRGDRVEDPSDPTRLAVVIEGPVIVGGKPFYTVLTADQDEMMLPGDELRKKATDRSSPASWLVEHPLVDPYALSRAAAHLKISSALTDIVYSFSAARTLFRPHQFKPVLKMIESPVHRLLLADEVGLGKTIEAGLIWTELDARSPMKRVLIVAPSGLVPKWQLEMERRFDREVKALRSADIVRFAGLYADRGDSARLTAITSYSQLRNRDVMDVLSNQPPTFDLAIFDEAHALRNPSTKTHQAAELITQNSDAVVFLSATPVNLGSDDLYNLMHLLRPEEYNRKELFASQIEPNAHVNRALRLLTNEFPPDTHAVLAALREVEKTPHAESYRRNAVYQRVVGVLEAQRVKNRRDVVELQEDISRLNTLADTYTRTRKRDLRDHTTIRRARHLVVELTPEERSLYEATLRLVAELRGAASGYAPALAAVMPARQAASCLPAMQAYLSDVRRTGRVLLDVAEGEEDDDDEDASFANLALSEQMSQLVAHVEQRSGDLRGTDTKFDRLADALRELKVGQGGGQVLLFSFFRLTLAYLDEQLTAAGYRCAQMHGGTPIRERTAMLERFRAGDLDILLCSEVGSEGLDFEFCETLINYDLPWNPMRLEQRIGRLDRFGQRHSVIQIFNFQINGTIDTDIFLRLYDRIGVFEESIGELEPILGSTVREITRSLVSIELSTEEQQALADRTALAVEAQHANLERFNAAQDSLISSDAFIEDALQDTRDGRRYLTPYELERYVAGFLREAAHPARLEAGKEGIGVRLLQGSPLLADRLRELSQRFLTPALSQAIVTLESGSMAVTFDAELAYDTDAVFLGHRHPLLRAVSEYYADPARQVHPGGYVKMPAPEADQAGRWIFYVFLLSATGLLPQRSLHAVAVDEEGRRVSADVGRHILAWLSGPDVRQMKEQEIPLLDPDIALRCYEATLAEIGREREESKARLAERNDALISSRQDSLKRELAARRSRLEEMANREGVDSRIRRMRLAQLANLESDIEHRIGELERQRSISLGFKVVLGGMADLIAKP